MSDLTTPPAVPSSEAALTTELRAEVIAKLSRLALMRAALREVSAPHLTQIAALQHGLQQATAEQVREIEALEAEIKALADSHVAEVFGDTRTLKINQLSLGARQTDKVEIVDGTEDDVIAALERMEKDRNRSQALYAGACLRRSTELRRDFIRSQWESSEEARAFFAALGIGIKETTSVSLTEIKPPKAKVTKEKLKDGKEKEAA